VTRHGPKRSHGQDWAIRVFVRSRDPVGLSWHRSSLRDRTTVGELPADLYVVSDPWPRVGRPFKHDVESWRIIDDWPMHVPITDAEIGIFEAWFGDLFDELFGPSR